MDRINISFAALQMNRDLHFSASVYGFGAGMFFIGYALCEVPSNLLLLRFGARRWLARIMFTWGLLAAAGGPSAIPALIVTILAVLYAGFGEVDVLRRILAGVSCAAVGLLIAVVFRMMMPLIRRGDLVGVVVLVAVFVAIGVARLPLAAVLLVAIPLSIAITFAMRRRAAA